MRTVPEEIMKDAAMAAISYMQLKGLKIHSSAKEELASQIVFVMDCFLNPGIQPGEELD